MTFRTKHPSHLLLEQIPLAAGQEWAPAGGAWSVLFLNAGAAYWLHGPEPKALSEGDLILVPPGIPGQVRASQIGAVRLRAFAFDPERLCGLLTFAELQFFKDAALSGKALARVYPAQHSAARTFAALERGAGAPASLVQRGQMLTVLGTLFDEDLARHNSISAPASPALHRFRELMKQMPEIELLRHTPNELASLCGCTMRHFNRLFREQFGTPPRARQTELRLRTAGHLLQETESKIIDVAFESGYRNLSLFNSLFKRRYKMTPSEWRKKKAAPSKSHGRAAGVGRLLLLLLASVLTLGHLNALAAAESATPGAGEAAATNAPPVHFEVKGYELNGNTLLPPSITQPLLSKHTGPSVTFETIRQALADLQMAYRDRGYISVAVALPPQELTNGIVHLQITEGRLAEISIPAIVISARTMSGGLCPACARISCSTASCFNRSSIAPMRIGIARFIRSLIPALSQGRARSI